MAQVRLGPLIVTDVRVMTQWFKPILLGLDSNGASTDVTRKRVYQGDVRSAAPRQLWYREHAEYAGNFDLLKSPNVTPPGH